MGPRRNIIAGVGVVLVSPQNYVIPRVFFLIESCSNNVAEYNALSSGMQLTEEIGVKHLASQLRDASLRDARFRDAEFTFCRTDAALAF